MTRRPAFLHRVPGGRVPLLHRYYQGAPTSCRPSRVTSFPSLGGTTVTPVFAPRSPTPTPRPGGFLVRCSREPPAVEAGRISHVPGEPQLCLCPALRPRPARPHQATAAWRRGPRGTHCEGVRQVDTFRGSMTRLQHSLSTLRRTGHPATTQDSLPAAGQALPGGLGYPQGPNKGF